MVRKKDKKVDVLGVPFDNVTMQDMKGHINDFLDNDSKENLFIVTANPEITYYAKKHPKYMNKILIADYIIPDGIGVVKASKALGHPLKERVPGIELMDMMLKAANDRHLKVFLLGATKETVKQCQRELNKQYPNITIKAKHGYKDLHDYKRVEQVKKFNPDFVFVAMGYPKQESWIYYYQHHFEKTIFMGVGGSFDVYSGNIKRAPKLFLDLNIEWLYRIMTDFTRLKRAVVIPKFLIEIQKQKLSKKLDPHANLAEKD